VTKHALTLVMGVSGSGNTAIGKLLAGRLNGSLVDAHDLHPEANINKMAQGEPLNDQDRWPWLDAIANLIK
jgi:gluconokinase